MRLLILGLCALGILASPLPVHAQVKNHPAVTPYAGSIASRRDDDGFKTYTFIIGVDEKGKTDEDAFKTLKIDGKVTRLSYENPKGRSAHEIFTNYREGLEKAGYSVLFACAEKECGPAFATSRWGRVTGLRYYGPDQRYLVAKASKGGQDIYVAVLIAKLRHQVEVVEVAAMQRGLVSARAIGEGLSAEGRVVLEGILFDTDKATIKPESKPALDAIAQYLKDNQKLNVFIVGHTDATGGFDHNMGLSRARAASVMEALAKDYGIAAARLAAHGVGPLSPRKSNANEAGRAENRRVEMVER